MSGPDWRSLPSLASLRAFEAASRELSYSGAARELNVTHAAVAQNVRTLESELGTKLMRRSGRGVALTDAGQQLAQPVQEAFRVLAEGVAQVRSDDANRPLRVTTSTFIVDSAILKHLPEFWSRFPDAQVSFSPEGCAVPVDLEKFDIGIRAGAKDWPGYQCIPLVQSPMIFVGAPKLVEGRTDYAHMPWLKDDPLADDMRNRLLRNAGFDPDKLTWVDVGDPKLIIEAGKSGLGIDAGPELILRPHIESGDLVQLDLESDTMATYCAIVPKGPLGKATERFLDWLIDVLNR